MVYKKGHLSSVSIGYLNDFRLCALVEGIYKNPMFRFYSLGNQKQWRLKLNSSSPNWPSFYNSYAEKN